MDSITMEQAIELFKLPRTIGQTAEGEDVVTNVGRFGPYIKYGAKYVSLKEDDPYTVELPRALELIRLKQEADANRIIAEFTSDGIQVLNGRYGPYVTNGKKNAKIPKDRDPKSITVEEARVMIEQAPERGTGRFGRGKRPAAKGKAASATAAAAAATNGGAKEAAPKPAARAKKSASARPPAAAAAKKAKSARSSSPPAPKGVANVVRKGRSAPAKAHARKTAARAERTAGKTTAKRARGTS
jgi:DNA topoisomerase I